MLVYLIVAGDKMHEHAISTPRPRKPRFRSYVQQAAGRTTSTADELTKLADSATRACITPEQFEAQKAKLSA